MQPSASPAELEPHAPAWQGPSRIGIGLAQGLLLYLLYTAAQDKLWPATAPLLFIPLALIGLLVPVILISALGHMTRRQLLLWAAVATLTIAALGAYDAWRMAPMEGWRSPEPSGRLTLSLAAGLFIAHALALAGSQERRRIAPYATYFEVAWKLYVQIAFCFLFVGATWLVLQLGGALFDTIKLTFLSKAMRKAWFWIPVTAFAFSCAMHLTDVKPGIVRGIRSLLHMLLSWILPVLAVLVGGFLFSLPFTGLAPLWATRSAAALLLSAAGAFVVLINAAWQDGSTRPARPIALAARVACLLLVPLTLLAGYALALRVGDHGWTQDRILGAACLAVAACYAGGYAAAALRRGWLPTLAGVNIAASGVVLAVLVLLLSPLADTARISVNSQMARLAAGKITLRELDIDYLYRQGARFGRAALARLEARAQGPDLAWLKQKLVRVRMANSFGQTDPTLKVADNLQVWPAGASLPPGFTEFAWSSVAYPYALPSCLRLRDVACDAFVLDLGGDATPEVILTSEADHGGSVLRRTGDGKWEVAGTIPAIAGCAPLMQAMREGRLRTVPPALPDLEVGGQRIPVQAEEGRVRCPDAPAPARRQPDAAR